MTTKFRTTAAASRARLLAAAIAALAAPFAAVADQPGRALPAHELSDAHRAELLARLAALEAALNDVRAELAATQADTLERIAAIPAPLPPAPPPAPAEGMRVGNTVVKIGGILDVDVHAIKNHDGPDFVSDSAARDFYVPGATPVGGTGEDSYDLDVSGEASRLFFTTDTDLGGEKVTGRFEIDFLGSFQGDERVTSGFSPRLRRAEFGWRNWLFGQSWSTFQILDVIPESASHVVSTDGMVFERQGLIRYTRGPFQFALENPNAKVGGPFDSNPTSANDLLADDSRFPDAVARYNAKGEWGSFSAAAIARDLNAEGAVSGQPFDDSELGWGVVFGGKQKMPFGNVIYQVVGGEGLGRYVGLNSTDDVVVAYDAINNRVLFDTIGSVGGLVGAQINASDKLRFNAVYSGLWADNPDFVAGSTTAQTQSIFASAMYNLAPKTTVGFEVIVGERETENGLDGTITRGAVSASHAF